MKSMLTKLAAKVSFYWDYNNDPLVSNIRTVFDTQVRPVTKSVSYANGTGPNIGYAGVSDGIVKILQMLEHQRARLGVSTVDRSAGTVSNIATAAQFCSDDRVDLSIVAGTLPQVTKISKNGGLVLPYRLHAVVDTSDNEWKKRMSRNERQWCEAQIRNGDYRLETASDDESFNFFYHRMHLPTMQLRHGSRARSETKARAYHCLFKSGGLLFVTANDVRLAGALAIQTRDGKILTPRLGGLRDGDKSWHRRGLLRLLSYLIMDYAQRTEIAQVDFSGLEAWFGSGLYGYKRRLGPLLVAPPDYRANLNLCLRVHRDNDQVRDFLVANPILTRSSCDGFKALYFFDSNHEPRTDIPYRCINVNESESIHLDDFLRQAPKDGAE